MTAGENLLIKILIDSDTKSLTLLNFEWLEGDEIPMYNFIIGYFKEYTRLPSVKLLKSKFSLKSVAVEDDAAYFIEELKARYIFTTLADKVPRLIKTAKEDSHTSLTKLRDLIRELASTEKTSDMFSYGSDPEERMNKYEKRIESGGLKHLPTGDDFLDKLMFGYSDTDLVTIGGRPGTKKTWILLYLIISLDYLLRDYLEGRPLLFISNELGKDELQDRIDCMRFKLCYTDFLKGDLDVKSQTRYERGLKKLTKEKYKSNILITNKCRHISDLELLVQLYNPAAVFLDGSYLMEPKMAVGWEKITFITQNLKAIALNNGCPIINTTQSRRRSASSGGSKTPKTAVEAQDDFAFADSYSQDSDMAMLMYPKDDSKWTNKIGGIVAKGRSIDLTKANFEVLANLTTMDFKFEGVETEEEHEHEEEVYEDY